MQQITIQYFDGCPNWKHMSTTVESLISELHIDAVVKLQHIGSQDGAVEAGFRGSPTLLLGGIDPFADEDAPVGLSCRIYQTDTGFAGTPSDDEIRTALIEYTS